LITANNLIVADAFAAAVMGIQVLQVAYIMITENEGLGIRNFAMVQFNDD
jgi:hypothetical protein